MENLCESANNEGEDTYDVLYLPTGYEPKGHDFLAADQDVDYLTLGKMFTEAYRGQVDHFEQEGVSVGCRRL